MILGLGWVRGWLLRFPIGSSRGVQQKLGLKGFRQSQFVSLRGHFQCVARRLHGLGKTACLSIGGGQGAENGRFLAL
jgi:hypothetical protein